jgi:hypothetical protein
MKVKVKRDEVKNAVKNKITTERLKILKQYSNFIMYRPIAFMTKVTIPISDPNEWNKSYARFHPVVCFITVLVFVKAELSIYRV